MLEFLHKSSSAADTDAAEDFSSTAGVFLRGGFRHAKKVTEIHVILTDTANTLAALGAVTALTNGMKFQRGTLSGSTWTKKQDILKPFKCNRDLLAATAGGAYEAITESSAVVGTKYVIPVGDLTIPAGEYLGVYLNDDLTGLTGLQFAAKFEDARPAYKQAK